MGKLLREERLIGVHPKFIKALQFAVGCVPFDVLVIEGVRTMARQRELLDKKATTTLKSKHLIQPDGFSWAVDTWPNILNEKKQLDWTRTKEKRAFKLALYSAAKSLGLKLRGGEDWDANGVADEQEIAAYRKKFGRRPFVDWPHTEIVSIK